MTLALICIVIALCGIGAELRNIADILKGRK